MHGLKTPLRELGSPYREVCRSIKLEGVSHPTSPKKRVRRMHIRSGQSMQTSGIISPCVGHVECRWFGAKDGRKG